MPQVDELPIKTASFCSPRIDRRRALSLLAAGIAGGLSACSRPDEEIVPYVTMPDRLVPGEPMKFATTLALSGYGRGALVTSVDGRPIKIEGNPKHPASLGATDIFMEAAVLSLYDPDRSRAVLHEGAISAAEAFRRALLEQNQLMKQRQGKGLRILTGKVTSPTLLRQIDDLFARFPEASWHAYDPIDGAGASAGTLFAYGRELDLVPHLERANIVVALDSDPIGHGPDQLRNARAFANGRKQPAGGFSRWYCVESAPTLTGAKADHRLALQPAIIEEVAIAIAGALGSRARAPAMPENVQRLVRQISSDLSSASGGSIVIAGRSLSAETHALVHWINARLKAPLDLIERIDRTPSGRQGRTLAELVRDLDDGQVDQLVILGVNPAYDAPADLDFARAARNAPFRLHMGCYADETAAISNWHLPQTHPLEAWSDLRSPDGTASLVQPLIRPLYHTRTDHELLALLADGIDASPRDLVRQTWQPNAGADFEGWWTRALHDGVISGSASPPVTPHEPKIPELPRASAPPGFSLVLQPDPAVWDGSFANNAWLQECPRPLTKQVWGNALTINPRDAEPFGVSGGDVVSIRSEHGTVEAPVLIDPAAAAGVGSLTLGYGRTRAGAIGDGIGADANRLRAVKTPWLLAAASISKTARKQDPLTTQNIVRAADYVAELYPMRKLAEAARPVGSPDPENTSSLLPAAPPRSGDEYAWAMVIDTSLCIGCNACVVACQAENNVPVVGPEEVARGRDMHWLRVDVYDHGTAHSPALGFQPVPCMHCEHAPCEPVCPVAASVHDSEGLNAQVYNRCIGTRFCQANCPYKVRRFNFRGYADGQEYANLGLESYRAQKNPEVTVRARGVMEKCTYCVQRISGARRAAEREDRRIGTDEVRTACQSACPTNAIEFGDLNQSGSKVNRSRSDPRHYALLAHLDTRPRTTYLADVRNPSSRSDGDAE
ncbi:4Fe-4S dicluster domain-containing protein [Bradyrhizobium vignae]|uniref:4Fe-4S ferredoxin iron-sulfur binding domain protein n=1 Tax=Bradyrhizobium vignae TaxID=1549949 RepID=A0A2U3Q6S7_9BRAD|nr:4Fe-4S dicluster domain-containing protein [Bradyrhizobium vignae]SPP97143.1 4Fe-4S ferredoxin iron-sulfur binding domain protein [Bradyrhizobium vignae]